MAFNELHNPPLAPVDETDVTLGEINLRDVNLDVSSRMFRFRRIDVGVNGIVPWHSHADRPALLYIRQGEITEYSTAEAGPVVRRVGDTIPEFGDVSHWWKNTGAEHVVILAADLAAPEGCGSGEC